MPVGGSRCTPINKELDEADNTYAFIPVQKVDSINTVKVANVFCGSGSTLTLVRNRFAKAAGLVGRSCKQMIITAGGVTTEWDTMVYSIPLFKVDGTLVEVIATKINRITESLSQVDMVIAAKMFDVKEVEITRPMGTFPQ